MAYSKRNYAAFRYTPPLSKRSVHYTEYLLASTSPIS